MSSITIKDVSKSFGNVKVLHNLNLEIEDGEFVALVGPSGCGKSTLLRILAGLDQPTEGELFMGGNWVNDLSPRDRNIAMVFQSYALYPHMTVRENMGFNLKISGMSKDEIKKSVEEAADILDLGPLLDRKPSQLSGGQRQRVAMGRALVRAPDAFLFDEPLSNLDAKLRVQMREEIKRLHKQVRTTSVYVTHDQIEAMTLADRIVIMKGGRIQQIGTPTELYQNPANEFVAGFIGSPSMNLIQAELKTQDGKRVVTLENGTELVSDRVKDDIADGPVTIGLRPENLRLINDGTENNVLSGVVNLIEPTGAQNHLKVSLGEHSLTVVDTELVSLQMNDTVQIQIAPENLHVFSRENTAAN